MKLLTLIILVALLLSGCETYSESDEPVVVEEQAIEELVEFPSKEAFEQWRDRHLLVEINGKQYRLPTPQYSPDYDCDDIAEGWQRRALEDGYLISIQVIRWGRLMGKRVSKSKGRHAGIFLFIGNDSYYQDTLYPYKLTFLGERD